MEAATATPPGVTLGSPVPAGVTLGNPTAAAPPPGVTLAPPKTPAAPTTTPAPTPATPNAFGQGYTDLYKGVYKGAAETLGGVMSLLNRDESHPDPAAADAYRQANPGVTPEEAIMKTMTTPDPRGHIHAVQDAADWLKQQSEAHGVMQSIGKMGEGVGEFLIPGLQEEAGADAAVKAPTYAQKAAEAAKAAEFLEKSALGQRLAGLASIGLRTIRAAAEAGGGVGAQTYIKTGGDAEAAKHSAALEERSHGQRYCKRRSCKHSTAGRGTRSRARRSRRDRTRGRAGGAGRSHRGDAGRSSGTRAAGHQGRGQGRDRKCTHAIE